jgi:ABC-type branched-subunit amino acid transport system substrate-binding protein
MNRLASRSFSAAVVLTACAFSANAASAQNSYVVGYITDLSGPLADSYTPTWEGFELYIKALNDRGGIGGKKVDVVLDDDGLKADRAVAAAKKQAERDNVVGIFGLSLSSTQGPVYAEMRKAGVPVVTTFSGILDALPPSKPFSYSTGVVFEVAGEAIGELIKNIKPNGKVVGMTFDSVGGRAAISHNKRMVESLGYTWDEVIFPVTTSDFTPFAQAVAEKKPDIVVGHYGSGQNLGMIPALRRSGYAGPYVVASYGVTEDTVRQAAQRAGNDQNVYYVTRYSTVYDLNPGVAEVAAAQKKYGTSKPFSSMHITGWELGKFAESALKACGWPCSREKLDHVIQTLKVDANGLTGGPIEMSPQDLYGPSYWRLYVWNDSARKMEPKSDWLKKTALKFPVQ